MFVLDFRYLDLKNAVWGGLMATGALSRGARGVVIQEDVETSPNIEVLVSLRSLEDIRL
jgi:regulator of RNase E activity RraA